MRVLKVTILALVTGALLLAQTNSSPITRIYATYQEATPSTSAVVLTVQQPTSAPRQITFEGATVYCSVACVPTLEMNGAAATTTAGTSVKLDTRAPTAASVVYTASNVGVGTVLNKYAVSAGSGLSIIKSGLVLGATATAHGNITIRTDSISGTMRILLMWSEPQ